MTAPEEGHLTSVPRCANPSMEIPAMIRAYSLNLPKEWSYANNLMQWNTRCSNRLIQRSYNLSIIAEWFVLNNNM